MCALSTLKKLLTQFGTKDTKLENYGIKGKTSDIITDLYRKKQCSIKKQNNITSLFEYKKGVRQGCPLSPILFNLYINDLIEIINKNTSEDIHLNTVNKINALLYADDLVLISPSKEGLQKQIDTLTEYCKTWKLKINSKKTKSMVFNRGNNIIKTNFTVNGIPIENVKRFTYLGFTISSKNCEFQTTIDDLSIKANRAIFTLRGKIKLSKLPLELVTKIFNCQIAPILLYGSEVWGPYMAYDYETWGKSKTEQVHKQFLKQLLGCNRSTTDEMIIAETGCRPLINQVIKRYILYYRTLKHQTSNICHDAFSYEIENTDNDIYEKESPNFVKVLNSFDLNINTLENSKIDLNFICKSNYDRYWVESISTKTKADSFIKFKNVIHTEPYLIKNKNLKHKIAMSRFRMSNNSLMVEIGRHVRPEKIKRNKRFCYFCNEKIEDEEHFLLKCQTYDLLKLEHNQNYTEINSFSF